MAEERLDNIRENQDVSIEILDPVTFEQQTYSAQDNNLISKTEFTTAFTSSINTIDGLPISDPDYIEFFVFDQNNTLIF